MPRYFFHTEDGERVRDEEGTELPDNHAARNEAVVAMADLVKWNPEKFWKDETFRLTVTDENGLVLYVLDLSATTSPTVRRPSEPGTL
jgi:hypothetical protein